ncbi:hypothetical protein CWR43_29910 [Rhizobium sullae]|uniref:Uncharacterized protein n=1 Tax=Rhizobium sullae TaxID=50338 RepID=A0A2N0D1B8_RHISU|nr:hypothetical protein CWR43_29910 [Rhizobium sullae]
MHIFAGMAVARDGSFLVWRLVAVSSGLRSIVNSGPLGFDLGQKLSTIVTSLVPTSKKIILERQEGMVLSRRAVVFGFTARC